MTFEEVVQECLATPELVREFDRLRGTSLSATGINAAVDQATGKRAEDLRKFFAFVKEYVWVRLLANQPPRLPS